MRLLLGIICGFTSMLLATLAGNFNSVSGFEAKNACFLHQAGNASPAAFRASDCVKPEIGDRSGHWSPVPVDVSPTL